MQKKSVLSMLSTGIHSFGQTEQKIGAFILKESPRIVDMPIQQLAAESQVSEATIVRFSRKLGFSGYSELKLILATELMMQSEVDVYQDIDIDEEPINILKKLSKISAKALNDTIKVIENQEIVNAVTLLDTARQNRSKIYLIASGGSQIITRDLHYKLMRLGISSVFHENSHIIFEAIVDSGANDVAVVVSSLGQSKEVWDCVEVLKRNQTKIILLTQFGNNRVIQNADVCLLTSNVENNLRLGSIASRLVHLQIIDMLFAALSLKRYDEIRGNLKKVKDTFREKGWYTT